MILSQNADDNNYPAGAIPALFIELDRRKITVRCNENGFTEDNVRAICAIGKSSKKKKDVLGYIGMFLTLCVWQITITY